MNQTMSCHIQIIVSALIGRRWLPQSLITCNSYTMAVRDFVDIYTQSTRAAGPRAAGAYVSKIPSSHGTSDIYHLGRTHLIGERTNENSSHLFYTVASEDRLWF